MQFTILSLRPFEPDSQEETQSVLFSFLRLLASEEGRRRIGGEEGRRGRREGRQFVLKSPENSKWEGAVGVRWRGGVSVVGGDVWKRQSFQGLFTGCV